MAISPLSGAGPSTGISSSPKPAESFGKVMKGRLEQAPQTIPPQAPQTEAKSVQQVKAGPCRVEGTAPKEAPSATQV
ncbi:MAG TPA: hypothetical protein VGE37_12150, partial [Archangium sp.]